METSTKQSQITDLLPNDVLARVERMRINSHRRFVNRTRGEHLSGRGGQSTEFADYRNYVAGDDIRFVDWNIFARLQKPYMKLFQMEEEMHVLLLVDASSSMMFEGKLDMARRLAAAFGVMGLMNVERVSCWAMNTPGEPLQMLKPVRGRGSMRQIFAFLESIEGGGEMPFDEGVNEVLKRHRGRGVCVALSDFLTFGDVRGALNRLFSAGLETFAVQIMSPMEIDPELTGDVRMVDCETNNTLDVSAAGDLVRMYHEYFSRFQRNLEVLVQQRTGRYILVNSERPVRDVLFDDMRRMGWIV